MFLCVQNDSVQKWSDNNACVPSDGTCEDAVRHNELAFVF